MDKAPSFTIYGLTDSLGQVHYVGQTFSPKIRYRSHRRSKMPFAVSGLAVLSVVRSRAQANYEERRWIEFYGMDNLYNKTPGGGFNTRPSVGNEQLFSIRISHLLLDTLAQEARRADRTVAWLMRTILEAHYQPKRVNGLTKKGAKHD